VRMLNRKGRVKPSAPGLEKLGLAVNDTAGVSV